MHFPTGGQHCDTILYMWSWVWDVYILLMFTIFSYFKVIDKVCIKIMLALLIELKMLFFHGKV